MDSEFVGERVVETTRMLRTRALVVAPSQDAEDLVKRGHFITPSFMVKKKKMKKKRMVYNQKRCNREFRKKRVKLENLASVNKAARRNGKAFSADVGAIANKGKDGYHMVEIDPRDQKYLTSDQGARVREASLGPPDRQAILDQAGVDIEGMSAEEISQYWGPVPQFVMCAGLPFGYQNSVWLFTLVQREIARVLRSQHGIRCSHYLDDWIFYPETDEEGLRWQPIIDRVWAEHGQMRQVGKGTVDDNNVWHIVQELEHLGSGISFRTNVFFVTPDMLSRIRKEAKSILVSYDRHQGRIGALWLAQFAGLVMSQHQAVRSARFRTRPLFDDLVRGRAYQHDFRNWVRLSRLSIRCINWWLALNSSPEVGRRVWDPPVNLPWTCDACTTRGKGWGATLPSMPLTGDPQQSLGLPCAGIWSDFERDLGITPLELKAVRRSLEFYRKWPKSGDWGDPQGWVSLIFGRSLLLWEDNAAVVSILNNYAVSVPGMRDDLHAIMEILEMEDAWMQTRYVRSAENPSDYFSRMPSKAEWVLEQSVADRYLTRWQPCTVDRFADLKSTRLPRFNSPYPCRGCEWVDAFSTSWEGECNWINPPWKDIGRIVLRLEQEPGAAAVLLLPHWPGQIWWPPLLALATEWERVSIDRAAVSMTGLAAQMEVVPEVLKRAGREDNMAVFFVPARV
jgi:hypothetical protein